MSSPYFWQAGCCLCERSSLLVWLNVFFFASEVQFMNLLSTVNCRAVCCGVEVGVCHSCFHWAERDQHTSFLWSSGGECHYCWGGRDQQTPVRNKGFEGPGFHICLKRVGWWSRKDRFHLSRLQILLPSLLIFPSSSSPPHPTPLPLSPPSSSPVIYTSTFFILSSPAPLPVRLLSSPSIWPPPSPWCAPRLGW